MSMQRIAVIGGGIAGLTVALRRAQLGDQVSLFEANARVGGQLRSETQHGFVVEHGAEGFVARSEVVPPLSAEAGIAGHIVEQLQQRSFRFDGQSLVELAPGEAGRLLGFQVPADELGRGIRSFWQGMAELPEQLALRLGAKVELHRKRAIASLAVRPGGVTLLDAHGQALDFDAAVVASTARSAASLLGDCLGPSARALQESSLLSSLTVTLAYRRDVDRASARRNRLHRARARAARRRASGDLQLEQIAAIARRPITSCCGCFFDRARTTCPRSLTAPGANAPSEALAAALPVRGPALYAFVSRWPDALPVFDPAHRARVDALEATLRKGAHPIWLAGAAFHGSGIDAAIRSAEADRTRHVARRRALAHPRHSSGTGEFRLVAAYRLFVLPRALLAARLFRSAREQCYCAEHVASPIDPESGAAVCRDGLRWLHASARASASAGFVHAAPRAHRSQQVTRAREQAGSAACSGKARAADPGIPDHRGHRHPRERALRRAERSLLGVQYQRQARRQSTTTATSASFRRTARY